MAPVQNMASAYWHDLNLSATCLQYDRVAKLLIAAVVPAVVFVVPWFCFDNGRPRFISGCLLLVMRSFVLTCAGLGRSWCVGPPLAQIPNPDPKLPTSTNRTGRHTH